MQKITPKLLLSAYANGYFPMAESAKNKEIQWFYPETRGIIPLSGFHIPASLTKFLKKKPFSYTTDKAFLEVITACAERSEDTWINRKIVELYCELHEMGFAHSVECWENIPEEKKGGQQADPALSALHRDGQQSVTGSNQILVGGLYGVSLGGAFFGESMFSRKTNASKAALVHLVSLLKEAGYSLLDCQYVNDHLKQFGIIEISREEYLDKLQKALTKHPQKCWD